MNTQTLIGIDGTEHILIDWGNGEYTGMPKATYDAQQAAQVAPQA